MLRYVVLLAGLQYGYDTAGFKFEPVHKAKDTMPSMGMVPPGNM